MRLAKAKAARGADMAASTGCQFELVDNDQRYFTSSSRDRLKQSLLGRLRMRRVQVSWRKIIGFSGAEATQAPADLLTSVEADTSREEYVKPLSP
jgi:hypothetical protein